MKVIAEQDQASVTKLVDEAMNVRSREAIEAVVETAYLMGRKTGMIESFEHAKRVLVGERTADSESEAKP